MGGNLGQVVSAHDPQSVSVPHHPAEKLYLGLLVAHGPGLALQVRQSWSAKADVHGGNALSDSGAPWLLLCTLMWGGVGWGT